MMIVQVYVKVYEKDIDGFIDATIKNAAESINEAGIVRFDFMQNIDDPQEFLLTEVYLDEQAALSHKETAHYLAWRASVAEMMASARHSTKYSEIYPNKIAAWKGVNVKN